MRERRSGWWCPAGGTIPGWMICCQTPTTSLRFGATTLPDTGHPASGCRSAPRNPVCCPFRAAQQQPSITSSFLIIVAFWGFFFCHLPAPKQAPRIIGQKLKAGKINIAWETEQPQPNEALIDGYKVSTVLFFLSDKL